jgi:hypothetical protein
LPKLRRDHEWSDDGMMGIFDWFKGTASNVTLLNDAVWLTKQAKFKGITQRISRRPTEKDCPDAIILVAHFRDSLEDLRRIVDQTNDSGSITCATADTLRMDTASKIRIDESKVIEILVAEYHPLPPHDEAVLDFARSLPCRCRLIYYVSLEDPLIRAICGEWVEDLLRKLGMAEDEVIESKLISRKIKAAQKKFGSQCLTTIRLTEANVDSAEMWMERNCSQIWPKG